LGEFGGGNSGGFGKVLRDFFSWAPHPEPPGNLCICICMKWLPRFGLAVRRHGNPVDKAFCATDVAHMWLQARDVWENDSGNDSSVDDRQGVG